MVKRDASSSRSTATTSPTSSTIPVNMGGSAGERHQGVLAEGGGTDAAPAGRLTDRRVGDAGEGAAAAGAEEERSVEEGEPVDEARLEQGAGERAAPFAQKGLDPLTGDGLEGFARGPRGDHLHPGGGERVPPLFDRVRRRDRPDRYGLRGPDEARVEREPEPAVEDDADRGAARLDLPSRRELRVVGEHGADPHGDRVVAGANALHLGARLLAGDPSRIARRVGEPCV